jgi:acyl-homoserine lactone acylase PvdQ
VGARVHLVLAAVLVLPLIVAPAPVAGEEVPDFLDPEHHAAIDDALLHGTVTPPGTDHRHATAEIAAYDDLVQGYPDLTEDELIGRYFKDGRFGPVEDVDREYWPRSDVRVVRDAEWGVPHIYGETDEAMAFGAGYVAAEDRLVIMEALRALGRGEAFELLEHSETWLADMEMARLYGYTEDEFQAQIDRLPEVYGEIGQEAVDALDEYVAGINHYLAEAARGEVPIPQGLADLGVELPGPWRTTDVVAIVRALFGAGGGNELDNAARYLDLVDRFGQERGTAIYEDFRDRHNEDGPVHTTRRFPYLQTDVDPLRAEGNVLGFENGNGGGGGSDVFPFSGRDAQDGEARRSADQLRALADEGDVDLSRLRLPLPDGPAPLPSGGMSNYLVVDGGLSATGHPILLGGPQAAYFSPQILMEYELHSPTIHARGSGFPGLSAVVIFGRTQDYAWTPTAGGSDMIDTYVVELCDPEGGEPDEDSYHYIYEGECIEMDRRLVREAPDEMADYLPDIYVERTVHGPVVARGEVNDTPVAVARKRSTYMKELDPAISIIRMNRNEATTGEDFVDIFATHNLSTNWAYANRDEIAYVHGGLYPLRPDDVHPDFPVWGNGDWEWEQDGDGEDAYLDIRQHPHDVAPERGYFTSWNNRPAPGWGASDAKWGFGPIYRDDLLQDPLGGAEPGSIDPVRLTQIMEEAGLTDLRGSHVLPLALRVLDAGSAPSAREERMRELLEEWHADGALRRDPDEYVPGEHSYEHGSAIAIMDEWWERLIRAVFDPVVGDAAEMSPHGFDNAPGPMGSAYQDGYYGEVWTDLGMLLGEEVASPHSQTYCGSDEAGVDGRLEDCAERLWRALEEAGDALASGALGTGIGGSDDPDDWDANAEEDRIRFLPAAALSMHWVNRPTSQVLAMFGAQDDAPGPGDRGPDDRRDDRPRDDSRRDGAPHDDRATEGRSPAAAPHAALPETGAGLPVALALTALLAGAALAGLRPRNRVRRGGR